VTEIREVHYLDGARNQHGPIPVDEAARLIRSGTIHRDTLIWYAGMPDWQPAGQVNGFASLFAGPPRPPAAPSPPRFSGAAPMRMAPAAAAYSGSSQQIQPQQHETDGRMGFGRAIATCFRKYVDFTGRARRAEYWYWHLFYWLLLIGLLILDVAIASTGGRIAVLTLLGILVLTLPTLAGTVRRLHDTDHSGWMILITFVPLVGGVVLLVFMCQRGTTGPNRFGPDPLGPDVAAAFD
jgi:uncharacterized membrane protein YhaH (DUF805 family)